MAESGNKTELVHLPRPSAAPPLLAAGLALVVAGLWTWWPFAAAGAMVAVISAITWVRANRDEIARMPREQQSLTSAGFDGKR